MLTTCLPQPTPYDPAEDPPSSIDPLGTVGMAEQLADILLPGFTARMWRARHLTFTALAALVGERAAMTADDSEEIRLEARLALERMFVSAIARKECKEEGWRPASKRLPGISLARNAISSGDQPLARQNFLKGQAINGPFGVVQRLARDIDVIDNDNRLSRNGQELLLAWSADQEIGGILDDSGSKSAGARWLKKLIKSVTDNVENDKWPGRGWWGWNQLADLLRPDEIGKRERKVLFRLITRDENAIRKRSIDLLLQPPVMQTFKSVSKNGSRGDLDREIFTGQIAGQLETSESRVDQLIDFAIQLVESYEQVSGYSESVFQGLLWGLTHRGGQSKTESLLADSVLVPHFRKARRKLAHEAKNLQTLVAKLKDYPDVLELVNEERLDQFLQDALNSRLDEGQLVESVMERHRRVQEQKRKGVWIERDGRNWTLLPGFGDNSNEPWFHSGQYLHPFRVTNAFSFLSDLGKVHGVEVPLGQED